MFQCQLFFIYQALVFSTTWPSRGVRHEVRNKSDAQVTSRDLMGEIHQYQRHLVSGDLASFDFAWNPYHRIGRVWQDAET